MSLLGCAWMGSRFANSLDIVGLRHPEQQLQSRVQHLPCRTVLADGCVDTAPVLTVLGRDR